MASRRCSVEVALAVTIMIGVATDAHVAMAATATSDVPTFAPLLGDATLLAGLTRDVRAAGVSANASPTATAQEATTGATSTAATVESNEIDAPIAPIYGAADSLELEFSIGPAFASDDTSIGLVGAGVHWFVADGVSFGAFAEFLYVDDNIGDAWGGGVGLLARWHFVRERDFSLFLEGGCGFALFSEDVPDGGTDHDFTPRAAIGATYALSDHVRLVGRAGWFHISNAQTGRSNPGLDSFAVSIGLSFTLGN